MFASKTIAGHLSRGIIGGGAMVGALLWSASHPVLSLLAIPAALVAFRGCPVCWTIGLVETVGAKLQGRSTEGVCHDGCAPHADRQGTGPRT